MQTTEVELNIERETQKAYLTKEAGWVPKSAVSAMADNDMILEIASWLVRKNEQLQKNAIQTKKESDDFYIKSFGTAEPSLRQISSAIADKEEENGKKWNPINKTWEKQ